MNPIKKAVEEELPNILLPWTSKDGEKQDPIADVYPNKYKNIQANIK